MTGQTVLTEKLRSFDYYKKKIPLYLQNSYGFIEHFRIWYDLLVGTDVVVSEHTYVSDSLYVSDGSSVSGVIDTLFEILNIFDKDCTIQDHGLPYLANEHYLELLNGLADSDEGKFADILDKIGALFGLRRFFSLVINGTTYELNLDNRDFLMLIKCTIIKNYFDGTYDELAKYYESVALPIFIITNTTPASCELHLIDIESSLYTITDNVKRMFLAGLLTVESMGITYSYIIHGVNTLALFDSPSSSNGFDVGVFSI